MNFPRLLILLVAVYQISAFEKASKNPTKDEKVDKEKAQFENEKERQEFFEHLRKSKLPLNKIGLPMETKDSEDEIQEFSPEFEDELGPEEGETWNHHDDKNRAALDDDEIDEFELEGKPKYDPRPRWPCRRRRWWGSCSTRRRIKFIPKVTKVVRKIKSIVTRRRSWRAMG